MYGAILGDIVGSRFEFDREGWTKDFELLTFESKWTDDTVMTVAVAEALMDAGKDAPVNEIEAACIKSMQKWGQKYPYAGYGSRFIHWVSSKDPRPYGSYGNGSAMRVSSAGWLYGTLDETRRIARLTAEVTHNHPEGIKGAQAVAVAIHLALKGESKETIRECLEHEFDYDLQHTCDEIRPTYGWEASCQGTVPLALIAFFESHDFESAIRLAVSLGGDSDTLACITGSIAQAYYKEMPEEIVSEMQTRLPAEFWDIMKQLQTKIA